MTEPETLRRADLEEMWRVAQIEPPRAELVEFAQEYAAAQRMARKSIVSIKDALAVVQKAK
jgi:hypothetical protein